MVWADRTLARFGEDSNIRKPTRTLVTAGPYAFSRNPEYVAFTLLYLGIALILNIAWLIILLPAAVLFIYYWVIRREERYLEGLFNDEYRRYWTRVRRWL